MTRRYCGRLGWYSVGIRLVFGWYLVGLASSEAAKIKTE